ncbi:glutathione S-transferase [Loktanella sp. Alg231-35]|uniref:glutathione S-transferase n=1 Tax=Loktanella sp. Alg231-35 TaxID=1922220 RepID=UPI000D55564B|nr:glutathione S-transferase [Loktanella sp. Alg231-35]
MTYELYIGDRTFSSWSLRGWLMFEKFGLDFNTHMAGLYAGTMRADLAHIAPARMVPAMQTPAGHVVTDSLAMAETLVENHPDINLYPANPAARALARSITAEMHSGFGALRDACPMMLAFCWDGFPASDAVKADLSRIEQLWSLARKRHGAGGRWLFGDYSLADVFYAPVAMRITAYDLSLGEDAERYVQAHLEDPAIRGWRAEAVKDSYEPWPYPQDLPRKLWPGDAH